MKHLTTAFVLLLGPSLGLSGLAHASAIFDHGDRHTLLFTAANPAGSGGTNTSSGVFTDSRTLLGSNANNAESAAQNSNVGPLLFSGTGSASMDAAVHTPVLTGAESLFDVTFTLAEVHDYVLDALLSGDLETGRYSVAFWLKSSTDSIEELLTRGSINTSGTLQPGTYNLYALASVAPVRSGTQTNGVARAGFDFSLALSQQVQQISLPASVLLVGLGLVAIRRRLG